MYLEISIQHVMTDGVDESGMTVLVRRLSHLARFWILQFRVPQPPASDINTHIIHSAGCYSGYR